MKIAKKLSIALILSISSTFFIAGTNFNLVSNYVVAQDQTITVQGSAALEGSNKDAAQKKALSDAFRNAVEKGLGVYVKSQSEVQNFELKKDEILTRAEGYVTEHEIIKESEEGGIYTVTIKAKVAMDQIGTDFKKLVGRVKTQMGNPSIAFVLTTWENKGIKTTVNVNQSNASSLYVKASDGVQSVNSYDSPDGSYLEATSKDPNMSVQTKSNIKQELSVQKIDESVWKKYPDMTIIDSFSQEFNEKGFDLKATDEARKIAGSSSLAQTSININDRTKIRTLAEKEGANYVARGEVQVIDSKFNQNTGSYVVTSKVGIEIIDVNSGDIVAVYSNTANASSSSEENARAQSIKKIAVLGAKVIAGQTIDKWQERANNGMKYTIELRNMTSARSQKLPFMKAVKEIAQITNQTSPIATTLLLDVTYKGKKDELGEAIIENIG
ncbi:hypothetical protein EON78_04670, partial [bacterium]